MVTVLCSTPSSPYAVLPINRATTIEEMTPNPRAITTPATDQNIPRTRRLPVGEASIRSAYFRRTAGQADSRPSLETAKLMGITLLIPFRKQPRCVGRHIHRHMDLSPEPLAHTHWNR